MSTETYIHARKRGSSVVENALLDDATITMQAKYLLIQFCSHRVVDIDGKPWKIRMKDIVNRSKNGRDAHYKALTELIENKYVARIRVKHKGRHVELIYVFGQYKEDVEELLPTVIAKKHEEGFTTSIEFGKVSESHTENQEVGSENENSSENPHPENSDMGSSDVENQYNTNNQETKSQETNNQSSPYDMQSIEDNMPLGLKEEENSNNDNIVEFDDDKPTVGGSGRHSEEYINSVISLLREATKSDLTDRSYNAVVRKVVDKYNQGKVRQFRDYLSTSLSNKIEQLELRRIKENAKKAIKEDKAMRTKDKIKGELDNYNPETKVPFYNWWEK